MQIVLKPCSKEEYLTERIKERLDITPEDCRERPLYKVYDELNREYINGVIIEKDGDCITNLCQWIDTNNGLDIKYLLPLSRYRVEEWIVTK